MRIHNFLIILALIPCAGFSADPVSAGRYDLDPRTQEMRSEVSLAGGAEGYIKALVVALSKGLPKKLDESTYLIRASAQGLLFSMVYKLPKTISAEEFESAANKLVLNTTLELCLSPEGRVLTREYDVTYRYIYVNKVGKSLFSFNVDKTSCETFAGAGRMTK